MRRAAVLVFASLVLVAVHGVVRAEYKPPTESQCRQMVDSMIKLMKDAPMPERDRPGAQQVIAKAEKIVSDNRKRGAPECDSWAAIGKLVVGQ